MSEDFEMSEEERDLLAGEYALGLLEGEERARAAALAAADPDFRRRAARWSGRLAPLLDEVEAVSPPVHLWTRIERRLSPAAAAGSNVHILRRKVNLWRGYSAAATALAASLALFLVARPADRTAPPPPPPPIAAEPLVAMMSSEGSAAKLVASFDPDRKSLIVAPAAGVESVPGHAHELWLIPADGKPRSMGIVAPGAPRRMAVAPPMLKELKADATLALSVEQTGGSPSGRPTGPVIASGKLIRT
ncbi:MAG TPA: anti-sigma factor [Allosphingosinicella sp.]|nr:anti-sigma factor [Allosphingosinicella sp.]